MSKRTREIRTAIAEKTAEARRCMELDTKDLDRANALLDEADALQKELDTTARLEQRDATAAAEKAAELPGSAVKAFADAARRGFKALNNEGTGADGGYTVPVDISTRIETLKEQTFSFGRYITTIPVSTNSGRRTLKNRTQYTGFRVVGEASPVPQVGRPQFTPLNWDVKKFGGYLPVTNELMEDSDANIVALLTEWLAGEGNATDNNQVLAATLYGKAPRAMTHLDDIQEAVIVDLAAFGPAVKIFTNANGVLWLNTLKDQNGRYLLTPVNGDPWQSILTIGTQNVTVVKVPNEVMPNVGYAKTEDSALDPDKVYYTVDAEGVYHVVASPKVSEIGTYYECDGSEIPFIIGDLMDYMVKFDRKRLTIARSNEASVDGFNAYEQDLTLLRGLMRADYKVKDAEAIVYGTIAV